LHTGEFEDRRSERELHFPTPAICAYQKNTSAMIPRKRAATANRQVGLELAFIHPADAAYALWMMSVHSSTHSSQMNTVGPA